MHMHMHMHMHIHIVYVYACMHVCMHVHMHVRLPQLCACASPSEVSSPPHFRMKSASVGVPSAAHLAGLSCTCACAIHVQWTFACSA